MERKTLRKRWSFRRLAVMAIFLFMCSLFLSSGVSYAQKVLDPKVKEIVNNEELLFKFAQKAYNQGKTNIAESMLLKVKMMNPRNQEAMDLLEKIRVEKSAKYTSQYLPSEARKTRRIEERKARKEAEKMRKEQVRKNRIQERQSLKRAKQSRKNDIIKARQLKRQEKIAEAKRIKEEKEAARIKHREEKERKKAEKIKAKEEENQGDKEGTSCEAGCS